MKIAIIEIDNPDKIKIKPIPRPWPVPIISPMVGARKPFTSSMGLKILSAKKPATSSPIRVPK